MKYSLLDLVQNILSSLDSAEVNSVSDSVESRQIAQIVRTAYFNIITRANLPEHNKLFSLTASGDGSLPVVMYRPEGVTRVDWIKYDNDLTAAEPDFRYVTILPLQQFLDMTHMLSLSETFVDSLTLNGQTFLFRNDKMPSFCTILQDTTFIFDSYINTLESTLQENNILCFGRLVPSFDINSDSAIPALDEEQFPLLLNEAKSMAFIELKQVPNAQAERESRRQWSILQKNKHTTRRPNYFDELPSFGRKR